MAKKIPDFKSEAEEKAFWETHDVREYINWDNAKSFVDRVFKDKKKRDSFMDEFQKKMKR